MPGASTAFQTGIHSARPAASAGCVHYSCTTHSLIYQSDGATWTTFATLTGLGLVDPMTTRGDIIVRNSSNVSARLAIGSSGKVLSSDGTDVSWQTASGGMATDALWDAAGDLAVGTGANTAAKLTIGTSGYVLTSNGTTAGWAAATGGVSTRLPLDSYAINGTYGDDFAASSLAGIWTRRNFTAAETFQYGPAATYMKIPMTGRAAGDGYFQTAPAGDWTFMMSGVYHFWANTRMPWSLCVVDSSGTGVGTSIHESPNAFMVAGITTYSTYSGSFQQTPSFAMAGAITERKVWVYLRKASGNYYGAYSFDGEVWSPETPAFASGITVDRVGMIVHPLGGVTTTAFSIIDQFNKIA